MREVATGLTELAFGKFGNQRRNPYRAMHDFFFNAEDLAPGDRASAGFNSAGLDVHSIVSAEDPLFEEAYRVLWEYFGQLNELESREVLARRLARNGDIRAGEPAMRYDLVLLRQRGRFVAACDHTAVADAQGVIVHVSHVLIDPSWRRTGLSGWVRAFPIQTARRCLEDAGLPFDLPISLVAEVEYPEESDERITRLKTFERAGFQKIDPSVIDYHQPDFRPPEMIDATAGPEPLPFQLLIRRVGCESVTEMNGAEVRSIVERLYRIYGRDFREQDMAAVWRQLETYPSADAQIGLIPPTQ